MKRIAMLIFTAGVLATGMMGCATRKVDWSSRAGNYTFDQAVIELGPPDKSAKLGNGTTVAEWYQNDEPRFSFGIGAGVSSGPVGGGIGVPLGGSDGKVLRLTFGPDGILQPHGSHNEEMISEPAGSKR